ncbi:Protein PLASTID MOVEMENT IMPAIRED 1-RELATED 1 [Cardamine amara subsp. amara]|uniref:Protein PLASTID MOVEMENT IMPAIRED 1-RELATED 1 n=1 Tax=Cardamine amara subsp. amara TaxID=228776 RepID=A0ABD0Z530_CARAN
MSKVNSEESSSSHKLLKEVESISEALYVNKNPRSSVAGHNKNTPPKPLSRGNLAEPQKEKKSFWNWPLRALSHVRNRRFNCCFSAQVHSVDGLPPIFQDLSLTVHWKRRDESLSTRPAKVLNGRADFKDKLTHTCSVYGSRSGPHHSAKYEAKHFLLYVSLVGSPEVDLGKHRMDLTRLLPLTLEELQDEKSSGKWSTTFQLTGKASGATLSMSFGYTVVGDTRNPASSGSSIQNFRSSSNIKQTSNNTGLTRTISAKSTLGNGKSASRRYDHGIVNKEPHPLSQNMEEIKDLHEIMPVAQSDLASSVNILYQKLDEEKVDPAAESQFEFDVVTKHIEPVESISREKEAANTHQSGEPFVNGNEIDVPFEEINKANEVPTAGSEEVSTENLSPDEPLVNRNDADVPFEELMKVGAIPTAGSNEVGTENLPLEEPVVNGNETDVLFEELKKAGKAIVAENEEDVETGTDNLPIEEENEVSPKDTENVVPQDDEEVVNNGRDLKEIIMKDLESALKSVEMLEDEEDLENQGDGDTCFITPIKEAAASSSRDVADSVASEFLDMLGIEHSPFGLSSESEPESPRERLLREFEMETLAAGSLFGFTIEADDPQMECDENFSKEYESDFEECFDLDSLIHDIEEEYQLEAQARVSEPRAKMLEDLETESLMREWGMNENTFQNSPPHNGRNVFHPADFPVKEPFDLPPLGDGLGPVVQTKNGGFLRSMNPLLFRNSKAGGSLVMQVSTPVVVPAEMGSGIMEILQKLATTGIEKLSMQANKVMPLDDITGKTMEEVLWETSPAVDGGDRDHIWNHHKSEYESDDAAGFVRGDERQASFAAKPKKFGSSSGKKNFDSEYVSLEDLAPLAMDQIEALSLEGLRIQSGMSDVDAPSDITAQSIGEISAFQGKSGCVGLEGAAGLQLLDIKDDEDDGDDGLMGLSLTLDEWMKLDSGDIGDEDEINERTSKILAAHHANPLNFIRKGSKGEKRKGKKGRKCGLLGNNFTVALMVQLRDPLRNYEPVGAPMLSLIQVERLFVPPKPIIYKTVSELRKTDEKDEEAEASGAVKEEKTMEEQGIAQYKISEVHLTGMKSETDKKPWGITTPQQQVQSGSRWLMANGMGKGNNKLPLMKPKSASTKPGDKLWSVSGSGSKWKDLGKMGKFNSHVRNPNVIMPK